jgi:uncharacterized protein YegP (UPF0339 family)
MAMKQAHFEVYKAKDGWRWALKAKNGKIVSDSGEAFTTKRGALASVQVVKDHAASAVVDVVGVV